MPTRCFRCLLLDVRGQQFDCAVVHYPFRDLGDDLDYQPPRVDRRGEAAVWSAFGIYQTNIVDSNCGPWAFRSWRSAPGRLAGSGARKELPF